MLWTQKLNFRYSELQFVINQCDNTKGFLANMVLKAVAWVQSHELRGPLSRMMGYIEILKNYDQYKSVKKDQSELIMDIVESAKELDGIIRKLNKDLENLDEKES